MTALDFDTAAPTPSLTLHKPVKSWVQVTASCNRQCKHCYGDCGTEAPERELSAAEYARVLADMADTGVIELLMEGGEPLHRPDLLEVLKTCTPSMLVRLRTNGVLLDDEMAASLKQVGIGSILIDFMGATAETHDWHFGVPGTFEAATRGLAAASRAGLDPATLMIMTKRNVGELQQFIDMSTAAGVKRVGILRLYPIGRARTYWSEMALSLPEQMAALDSLVIPDGVHLMRSWHPRDANCCWQASGVTSTGKSVGCSYLREFVDFGDLREQSFLDTWQHPHFKHLRKRDVPGHCPECEATQGSAGGCRSTAYAFTGDWNAPDPFCSNTTGGIDVSILPARPLQ